MFLTALPSPLAKQPTNLRGVGLKARLRRWCVSATNLCARWCSEILGPREKFAFGILMYHRITEVVPGYPVPTWNVTPSRFRAQLKGLLDRGFVPWPLRKVVDYHSRNRFIPRKAFVVTFDDCYENVFTNAWPILEELKIPATLFLATAYLDSTQPFPSDDWVGAGATEVPSLAWRPIRTEQCQQMQQSPLIELAAHTHTHADFRGKPAELTADLQQNLAELKSRFGLTEATFAFPYGTKATGFSGPVLAEAARAAGLLCSLTTEPELVHYTDDPFDWGRFHAEPSDSAGDLAAKLSGWYGTLRTVGKAAMGLQAKSYSTGSVPETTPTSPSEISV